MKPKRLLAVEIDFLLVGLRLRPEVLAGWPAIKTVLKPERFPFLPPPSPPIQEHFCSQVWHKHKPCGMRVWREKGKAFPEAPDLQPEPAPHSV